jgi:hypothetical protein
LLEPVRLTEVRRIDGEAVQAAVSADGNVLAVERRPRMEQNGKGVVSHPRVDLFDVRSGRVVRTLPASVTGHALAFSRRAGVVGGRALGRTAGRRRRRSGERSDR